MPEFLTCKEFYKKMFKSLKSDKAIYMNYTFYTNYGHLLFRFYNYPYEDIKVTQIIKDIQDFFKGLAMSAKVYGEYPNSQYTFLVKLSKENLELFLKYNKLLSAEENH